MATDPLTTGKHSISENVFVSIPQLHKFGIFWWGARGDLYFGMHAIDEDEG